MAVLKAVLYATDIGNTKSWWQGKLLPINERILAYGLPIDPNRAADELVMWHDVYGNPGENIGYEILFDMKSGICNPLEIGQLVWEVNGFLRSLNIPFVQGVHCNTKREYEHPHVHVVMSAIYPLLGKKVNVDHGFIILYKNYANQVLFKHGLPLIKIGFKSLPFRVVIKGE